MANLIKVSESMTDSPEVVRPQAKLKEVRQIMRIKRIRHLPVVSRGRVVGVISERDTHNRNSNKTVSELMIKRPYRVHHKEYLYKVTKKMAEEKLGCAIIENNRGDIVGIFTTTDALFLLSRLLKNSDYAKLKMNQIDWSEFPKYMI